MATDNDRYDLVVFGATGFTGQFVVEEVARVSQGEKDSTPIRWAIAGRNEGKLKDCLNVATKETGLDLSNVEIITADITDESSIDNMTKQSKVILNCVGPFCHYGRPVVKSCIKNGTDQVDITGEPDYVERMKLEFDREAEEAGVHIVNCCALDSVPADVGLCHLTKHFPGRLNSAEGFLYWTGTRAATHTGTMESLSLSLANLSEANSLQAQLYPTKLPKAHYPKGRYYRIHKNSHASMWGLPFPSDEGMVYRSQRYLSEETDHPFVQYQGFVGSHRLMPVIGAALGIAYLYCFSFFSCSRNFLFKHPKGLTFGTFSKEGPSRESLRNFGFGFKIVGEGWKEKLSNKSDKYSYPPNHKMVLEVLGPDPAYKATSIMLVSCAMTLLREKMACNRRGGVVSPGMTFINTNIVDRINDGGVSMTINEVK